MYPFLFSAGSFRLPTFGVLVAVGLCVAIYTVVRFGRREGLDSGLLIDFSTWLIAVALLGAKALMVLSDWPSYRGDPGQIFSWATLQAGGVFYGGFVAAVVFALLYTRRRHMPVLKVFDVFAPAIAVGQSIGRLGCFAAGDDYGRPTTAPWGVIFTNSAAHELGGVPLGVRLHPTQIYESLATLLIFGLLLWRYRRKTRDGEIFVLYLGLYGVARFFIEFFRGDEDRGFVFNHLMSTSQFIALGAIVTAVVLAMKLHSRSADLRGGSNAFARARDVRS